MPLDPHASHPGSHSYVLKLHRDAKPQDGLLFGRLENLQSGRRFVFGDVAELLQCLASDAAAAAPDLATDLAPDIAPPPR